MLSQNEDEESSKMAKGGARVADDRDQNSLPSYPLGV